jgi:hypothetical protein
VLYACRHALIDASARSERRTDLAINSPQINPRVQEVSMTIEELNELIERVAARPGLSELEEMKSVSWMLDQQEYQTPRAQQDSMTIQELNELIECAAGQPSCREFEAVKLLDRMLDQQDYPEDSMTSQEINELIERAAA